jgi:polyhydroxybutyrate depolymerase
LGAALAALAALATPGGAVAATPAPSPGCHAGETAAVVAAPGELRVGDERRTWILDVPAGPTDRALPVVFAFHGFGDSAANFRRWNGLADLGRRAGFVVVTPDGHEGVRLLGRIDRGWDRTPSDEHDLAFVRVLLDTIGRDHCLDGRRVYATGFSNGGFFASLLGCRLADRLAAVAPVAGVTPLGACTPARPMPILILSGAADPLVTPDLVRRGRDWWAAADRCGPPGEGAGCLRYADCAAPVVACEGPEAHVWPAGATDRIWEFFAAQSPR